MFFPLDVGVVTDLAAKWIELPMVLVTWTAPSPAPSGGYRVKVLSEGISDITAETFLNFTISHFGVYTIQVEALSMQHCPSDAVKVNVTVMKGDANL